MATTAVLKQRLISHHNSLIENLENKYMNHICSLLQQKKCIILEMQNQLYQQFERIDNLNQIRSDESVINQHSINIDISNDMISSDDDQQFENNGSMHESKLENEEGNVTLHKSNHISFYLMKILLIVRIRMNNKQ